MYKILFNRIIGATFTLLLVPFMWYIVLFKTAESPLYPMLLMGVAFLSIVCLILVIVQIGEANSEWRYVKKAYVLRRSADPVLRLFIKKHKINIYYYYCAKHSGSMQCLSELLPLNLITDPIQWSKTKQGSKYWNDIDAMWTQTLRHQFRTRGLTYPIDKKEDETFISPRS